MAIPDIFPQWGQGRWRRTHRSNAHLPARYAYAINSLGEMICLGCGTHFPANSGATAPKTYCSQPCRDIVSQRGGRLTRADVQAIIATMAPLS